MIKTISTSLLSLSLLSTLAFAKTDVTLVNKYMDISGANVTLGAIPEQITSNITQTSMMYGQNVDTKEIAFLEKVFDKEKSLNIVKAYLVEHFDDAHIKNILDYYDSPLGKKVTDASLDSLSPNAQAEIYHFIADLQSNPPSKKRAEIIHTLIVEQGAIESTKSIFKNVMQYMNAQIPEEKKIPNAKIDEMMQLMQQTFSQQFYLSYLYTYRDISDNELQKVIAFYKTPAGKEELSTVIEAMNEMLKEGFHSALKQQN